MKTTLMVKGTHCNSCKLLIEDVLKDISGVKSASVDFKTGKTVVEHDAGLDIGKLKKEIEGAGSYKVLLPK